MNNTYKFHGIEHKKFVLSAALPTVLSIFLFTALLLVIAEYSTSQIGIVEIIMLFFYML